MTNKIAISLLTLALALLVRLSSAEAGGPIGHQLVFVNMTPDGESGGESSQCAKSLMRVFKADEWISVRKTGETKTRAATGVPKGGPHFMTWKLEQFESLKKVKRGIDEDNEYDDNVVTVVLVDCRPAKNSLDILAIPAKNKPYRLSLRGVKLTPKLIKVFARRLHSMVGISFDNY